MTEEACRSAQEPMDEQREAQERASKPFKTSEPCRPDLIVETQSGDETDSSSVTCAVAKVPGEETQRIQNSAGGDKPRPVESPPVAKAPHIASISQIGKPTTKVSPKGAEPSKNPMTPRRFFTFVTGLFLAGMAGSFSNRFITDGIEAAFPPQYVKDFHQAEALRDRDQAFKGMHRALEAGEQLDPQSRRFNNLTASLAEQLDDNARYLEAKVEWAKAAVPSDIASPDLRERKRSYLINEAESEHLAVAAQLEEGVDSDLLKAAEDAGAVFQKSEVIHHGVRAFHAYVAAGALAADAKDFDRARKDFARAAMIADTQWQGGASMNGRLLEARWHAEMQELLAGLLALHYKPILRDQYIPARDGGPVFAYLDLKERKYDVLDAELAKAQKAHLQDVWGNSIVGTMYANLGRSLTKDETNASRKDHLAAWAASRPNSAKPLIALAYWYNAEADAIASTYHMAPLPSNVKSRGFEQLYEASLALHRALVLEPKVAFDPSFVTAIQSNLAIGDRLVSWSSPQAKLVADLHSAAIAMMGDDAQIYLNEIADTALHEPRTSENIKALLRLATDKANKIGSDAGDEFYVRAVERLGADRTSEYVDQARLKRGESLQVKKFGL